MAIAVTRTEGSVRVALGEEVTLREAQELAAAIGAVLDGCTLVAVDTSALCDVDTGILQLLCSVRRTAPAFRLDAPGEEFLAAVDRCGLRRELLGGLREDL